MLAGAMHKDAYRNYRVRLELLLNITTNASDQEIHELIEAGSLANSVLALRAVSAIGPSELQQIIPLRTLKARLTRHQRLTLHESDRMFRFAQLICGWYGCRHRTLWSDGYSSSAGIASRHAAGSTWVWKSV